MATYANSTTNTPLSRVIISRGLNTDKFVGPKIFTPEESDRDFGKIYLFDQNRNFDRPGGLEREDGGLSKELKADYSTTNFICKTIAAKHKIPDKYIRNSDPVIAQNHKKGMSLALAKVLWKDREEAAAALLSDNANFVGKTRTLTGQQQWSDYENSNPWLEIGDMAEQLELNCEEAPTFAYMGREVLTALMYHPYTLALLKDTEYKTMSMTALGAILRGQLHLEKDLNIYVGRSVKNTAAQGATPVNQFQHGKNFVLGYQNPDAGILYQETFGKMFYPKGVAASSVEEFRMPGIKATFIEVEMTFGFKIIDNNCAQQAKNVVV